MPAPQWWKEFYAAERAHLGKGYLENLVREARVVSSGSAIMFPHTRLVTSGHLIAATAKSIIESRCDTVLALGVLHGRDRERYELRGVYSDTDSITSEEFSLDNFEALIAIAAEVLGRTMPVVIKRFPFLTGANPTSLTGYEEIAQIVNSGVAIAATADWIHHGAGYNTPPNELRDPATPETAIWARKTIAENIQTLSEHNFSAFEEQSLAIRSDFRDSGPVLASLLGKNFEPEIYDMALVDYAEVLEAEKPTWVAAALVEVKP
jgi:hypothetical protein